jgi:hypothetical protein
MGVFNEFKTPKKSGILIALMMKITPELLLTRERK